MPLSSFGYVVRLKKFGLRAKRPPGRSRHGEGTHLGVQARNRWTLGETGFVAVAFS